MNTSIITIPHFSNDKNVQKFLDSFSDEELVSLEIDYSTLSQRVDWDNPLSIKMGQINESRIISYPIDKTIDLIQRYFKLNDKQIIKRLSQHVPTDKPLQIKKHEGFNNQYHIEIFFPNIFNNFQLIDKAMKICGYFQSYPKTLPKNEWVHVYYDALSTLDISNVLRTNETILFHITPAYNINKIKHIGISPKSKNDLFNHPDRIYLFKGSISREKLIEIGEELSAANQSDGNDRRYCIITLSLEKILEDTPFFLDPNAEDAIYTTVNIRANAIINIEELIL